MLADWMVCTAIVLEAVGPDKLQVINKLGLGLVCQLFELFGHQPQIHRMFNDWTFN